MALEERDAVFGYIKPVKAELKVKEWEAYQGLLRLCKRWQSATVCLRA